MLKPKPLGEIPADTKQLGEKILGKENLMRRIGEEWAEIVADEDFAAMYSHTGQPALSPALLALVCVLQAIEHLSDAAAAAMAATRIDWKYALHLPLDYSGFDASVLSEFRSRLIDNKAQRLIFDRALERMKAEGLLKGRGLQRTDSLIILSAVKELNRLEFVYETMRLALEQIAEAHKEWLLNNIPRTWIEKYAQRAQSERLVKESGPKAKLETEKLLLETGREGFKLLEIIDGQQTPSEIRQLSKVQLLREVWSQQYRLLKSRDAEITALPDSPSDGESAANPENKEPQVLLQKPGERASEGDVIRSPHDAQLRYGKKGGKEFIGYKLQLTETADEQSPAIITDIEVTAVTAYDGSAVEKIHQRLNERDLLPETHLADGGYISGELIAQSRERGVELLGPINPNTSLAAKRAEGFSAEDFKIDIDAKEAFCPEGQPANYFYAAERSGGKPVLQIMWDKRICQACPSRDKCVESKTGGRALSISPYYKTIIERRKLQSTPEFRSLYRRRAGVEATFSHMVCCLSARTTQYRGRQKTDLKFLFLAVGVNFKRVNNWKSGLKPQRKRSSALKKLIFFAFFINYRACFVFSFTAA